MDTADSKLPPVPEKEPGKLLARARALIEEHKQAVAELEAMRKNMKANEASTERKNGW